MFVPLAMPAVGYAAAPAFPYVDPVAFVGYAAFGALVGGLHATLTAGEPLPFTAG